MYLQDRHIGIIGAGQLGCSLGLALKQTDAVDLVTGYDLSPAHLTQAMIMGAFDREASSLEALIKQSNVILICTPLHTMEALFDAIGQYAKPGTVVSDVGSVKAPLLELAEQCMPQIPFIPGHPIAGTEKSGPVAGDPQLFRNRKMIFTPTARQDSLPGMALIQTLWQTIGARVEVLEASMHDRIYGLTSHLAQLLAYVSASCLATGEPLAPSANPHLYSFLRIGGSDSVMWLHVFEANRTFLLSALRSYIAALDRLCEHSARGYSLETYLDPIHHWRKGARLMLRPEEWCAPDITERVPSPGLDLLPVIVAYSYCDMAMEFEHQVNNPLYPFLGAGFYGVSQPAVLEPLTASALLVHRATQEVVQRLRSQLKAFEEAIGDGDSDRLLALIHSARESHTRNIAALGLA